MKSKIFLALCAAGVMATTSCGDYLETSSKSNADADFVFSNMTTAQAAMDGAYVKWHDAVSSQIFGDGLYYALDIAGSDIMRHPEAFANQLPRHQPETFYNNGTECASYNAVTYGKEDANTTYSTLFSVIGKANAIASAIEETSGYKDMMQQTSPTDLSDLYGQAICLRATAYRELIKYYGDVPFQKSFGSPAGQLVSRDSIYDVIIEEVNQVAPLMKPVTATGKNHFSSTYAYALVGRLALEAAGYQTRRNDITPVSGNGVKLTIETMGSVNNDATYGRRSDYKDLYAIAKVAFNNCLGNLGTCSFCSDYSTFFTELHESDNGYATESIYEEPFTQGASGNDPRSYSLGRPSNGGSSKAYPCKAYGQGRINPAFYYGMFDPNDVRRDLACTVTGSTGKGYETLIPFTPNSKAAGGGICCNKFDENRQPTVWTANQRRSGINAPYMRLSEVYLGYAEACQVCGDQDNADKYYNFIHKRAGLGEKSNVTFEEIIDERGFEFAGEGDRRFTLIRTGLLPAKIKAFKELTHNMIEGLKANHYYDFGNGNVISDSVYVKMVDPTAAPYSLKSRLTTACTDKTNPVLYPGWRGQKDWESVDGFTAYTKDSKSNVAIMGLFEKLSDEKIAELKADGYTAMAWGIDLVNNQKEYDDYLFNGYTYDKAPIYLFPFSPNNASTGGFKNGYGFAN